jgi:hypothetical protein
MNQKDVRWDCGTRGIGVVVSDTMMFQRGAPLPSDRRFGSFYGLALPLVKRGMPAEPVQLENAHLSGGLSGYKVLLMTYEGMKPMTPAAHDALAAWVKAGGVLVFLGDDSDPFNKVRSWWNEAPYSYAAPREHLFERLGLAKDAKPRTYTVGKGALLYDTASPAALTYKSDGADHVRRLTREACRLARLAYQERNYLALRRGPYVVAAGLDESVAGAPRVLRGRFVNLFDAGLAIHTEVTLTPGSRYLLLDLDRAQENSSPVLAAAAKVLDVKRLQDGTLQFYAEGPQGIEAAVRLKLSAPASVTVDDVPLPAADQTWDAATKTCLLRFPNSASGHWIRVKGQ